MEKCWAHKIEGCCSILSSEHYVSSALFGDSITIKGFSWCKEPKTLPNAALVANILCKRHNETLSQLDNEAKKLWVALDKLFSENNQLSGNVVINGSFIERWMIKTLCNIMVTGKQKFQDGSLLPPKELVEIVYGMRQFEKGVGLSIVHSIGNKVKNEDRITASDVYDESGLLGIKVGFRGVNFVTTFSKQVDKVRDPEHPGIKPLLHIRKIQHKAKRHHIIFHYNNDSLDSSFHFDSPIMFHPSFWTQIRSGAFTVPFQESAA